MKKKQIITMAHGNGGKHTHDLVRDVFSSIFNNPQLLPLADAAIIENQNIKMAFSTDSYVIKPLFFPGGDIGKLAVAGTINDLAVMGAKPRYLSVGMIIEEGFPIGDLEKITHSMQKTALSAGVSLVTGDTKVVEKGNADGIFINTTGIGFLDKEEVIFSPHKIQAGDHVLINGSIGVHGVAVMAARKHFPVSVSLESDCASLNGLIFDFLKAVPSTHIRIMRDPTRGGLATTLNELLCDLSYSIEIDETKIPVPDQVNAVCELTGFDPLYLANEGKVVIICAAESSETILKIMKSHALGKEAAIIGKVTANPLNRVILHTAIGGTRIIDMLVGDMLPRIC